MSALPSPCRDSFHPICCWTHMVFISVSPGQAWPGHSVPLPLPGERRSEPEEDLQGLPLQDSLHPPYPNLPSTQPCRFHPLPGRRTSSSIFTCLLLLPRLVVGAPLETNGHQKTGDVYKCPATQGNCTKLNLGNVDCPQGGQPSSRARQALKHVPAPSHTGFSQLP